MIGLQFLASGFLLLATPFILAGGTADEKFHQWMANLPLRHHLTMHVIITMAVGLVILGCALTAVGK